MRKILIYIAFLVLPVFAFAQTQTENYVKKIRYNTNFATESNLHFLTQEFIKDTIIYYDGLGRPKQMIAINGGAGTISNGYSGLDHVYPIEYDDFGRKNKDYLPLVDDQQIYPSYAYRDNNQMIQGIKQLYSSNYPSDYGSSANPYTESVYDGSPLNRVKEKGMPGKYWDANSTTYDHTIKYDYKLNVANEVKYFIVNFATDADNQVPELKYNGYYKQNELFKVVTKNENWTSGTANTVEEFKDKNGNLVLKRNWNVDEHDTYYIYDRFNNLTYVIPPLASDQIVVSSSISQTILDELCYQYRYDSRNRVIEKKLPGKGWESIVYDRLDRPVLTQDSNQKQEHKWLFTKYDQYNRMVYMGVYTDVNGYGRDLIQKDLDLATSPVLNETRTSNYFSNSGATVHYTNNAFPTSNIELLTVNYYDNYNFDREGIPVYTSNDYSYTLKANVNGLETGTKTRILGSDGWITSLSFYDDLSRVVKTHSVNSYFKSENVVDLDLTYFGQITRQKTTHKRDGMPDLVKFDVYYQDLMGREKEHYQTTDATINYNQGEVIADCKYDKFGKLVKKYVGGGSNKPLQTLDYFYNVRGWLWAVNDAGSNMPNSPDNDLFAYKISYQDTNLSGSIPLYNGNISEVQWRSVYDNKMRSYRYHYDFLNRLTSAIYVNNGSYTIGGALENFNEGLSYDKNGNITSLSRYGFKQATGTIGKIDQLTYTYATPNASNKLMRVSDSYGTDGFKDGNTSGNDYSYDSNGNMTKDLNKKIGTSSTRGIVYNYLNLPEKITFSTGGSITYVYDSQGVKRVKKVIEPSGLVTVTEYDNGFVYEQSGSSQNALKFYSHEEGYVKVPQPVSNAYNSNDFQYIYQYKDHLGNVRLSYTDVNKDFFISANELVEENHYYAFGLKHKGYSTYHSSIGESIADKYKYNGKELQDELGLGVYDYGARFYDPEIGKFWQIDPVAETSRRFSPHSYAVDNPVYFIDRDGMYADVNDTGGGGGGPDCPTCPTNPFGGTAPKSTSPYGSTLGNFTPSEKTNQLFDEAKEYLGNVFDAEFGFSLGAGVEAKVKVGPLEAKGSASLVEASATVNRSGTTLEVKGLAGGAELGLDGIAQGEFSYTSASTTVEIDNTGNTTVTSTGNDFDFDGSLGGENMNLSTSFTLAATAKVPVAEGVNVKVGGSINFYNAVVGAGKMIQGGASYLGDYVSNFFSGD